MHNKSRRVRQAIKLFPRTSYSDLKDVKALRRGWLRSISLMGPRWLLADENKATKLVNKRW